LQSMEQIRRIMRPTDVPDTGKNNSCSKFYDSQVTNFLSPLFTKTLQVQSGPTGRHSFTCFFQLS
jgi:hypothetical protein